MYRKLILFRIMEIKIAFGLARVRVLFSFAFTDFDSPHAKMRTINANTAIKELHGNVVQYIIFPW